MTVESGRAKWHVFVADDDDDTRTLMANAFKRAGFDVRESRDGEDLLRRFFALASDRAIVVSDIGMPICDGIAATAAVKRRAPRTPVLLVTAFGDRTTLAAARDAGADHVLLKPIDMALLVRAVMALLIEPAA
jgi:DNA-binding response OmpR family regulator